MKKNFAHFIFRKQSFLTAMAFSLFFLIAIAGEMKSREKQEMRSWVQHTIEVLGLLEEFRTTIYQISNDQKSYIITGNGRFIKSFGIYTERLSSIKNKLSKKITDNPIQLENLTSVMGQSDELVDYYSNTVDLVQAGNKAQAITIVTGGKGKRLLDSIIGHIEKMNEIEQELLSTRIQQEKKINETLNTIVVVGIFFGVVVLVIFSAYTYRQGILKEEVEKELDRNAQIQKAIFKASAIALIATDGEGKITFINPAAEKLLGYESQELIGENPIIYHDAHEMLRMAEGLEKRFGRKFYPDFEVFSFKGDQGLIEADQWTFVQKDGKRVQVKLSVTPVRDQNGEPSGYLGVAIDLTKQLEFEDSLKQAREEALIATQAKSEFLANMSHEIRTPMNAILGMAELLNETNLDPEQKDYVRIFKNAGSSLLGIINDILDISKIEANHLELHDGTFSLKQVVESVAETMAVKAHQKHLELVIDIDESMNDNYIGDSQRLRQVFLNLLGNAIKFTRVGEVILKIYAGTSDKVYFEVHDTGIGMTEKQMNVLFQRFSQADTVISKEFGGTGLGLNITKKLIEMMGGEIKVESTLGMGSVFKGHISLKASEEITPKINLDDISLEEMSILVVDDNQTNRLLLRNILEKQGAHITEAENGEIAWDFIDARATNKDQAYDLILIDGQMPRLDGFGLARRILDSKVNHSLLLMLTSDNRPGDMARSKEMGIFSLLVKPILKEELMLAISRAIHAKLELPQSIEAVLSNSVSAEAKGKRILLVDDNEDNLKVARAFLKNGHHQIMEARNGKEALKQYQSHEYDIVLMDMNMPVMDGHTATRELRKIEKDLNRFTPVVALTAYAHSEEIQKSLLSGCNAHLSKPYAKKDLLDLIATLTNSISVEAPAELADLLPDYLASRKEELQLLRDLVYNRDFKQLENLAHKIAGSAGSYGLDPLSLLARQLESCSKNNDFLALDQTFLQYQLYLKRVVVATVVA